MDELMNVGELSTQESITSLELVKQVNLFREQEGNRSELRHDTLRDIIKDEFYEEILSQQILEKPVSSNGGRPSMVFELTLSQAKQVLVRESKFVRKAVIAYIDKLENVIKQQFKVPSTFREALLLAAAQQEEIEKQQLQLTVQAPKVEVYEEMISSDGLFSMQAAANVLGYGRNKFMEKLRKIKILQKTNIAYRKYIKEGYFEEKVRPVNGENYVTTFVTSRGMDYLNKKLKAN